ncbi:FXYD domain-containing ion transport regulator 3-like [Chiloscyllium plagiosum]|uniref:FXYD domain-containing ion transport regulator 3-like n=1 Tax=Chiloscyllium plagiosum TaxID=36176 RepID=UPI001CB85D25|nr:FXYD domain-containing ion transport regulator 3-like [Chiloscyllium plagiosum]
MTGTAAGLIVLTAVTRAVWASAADNNDDRFTYDYYRLRVVGLIVAAVLCVIGIIILLAGKCRCKFNQNKRTRSNSGIATAQHLLQPGEATEC